MIIKKMSEETIFEYQMILAGTKTFERMFTNRYIIGYAEAVPLDDVIAKELIYQDGKGYLVVAKNPITTALFTYTINISGRAILITTYERLMRPKPTEISFDPVPYSYTLSADGYYY